MSSPRRTRRDFLHTAAVAALGATALAPSRAASPAPSARRDAPHGRPARIATVCHAGGAKPTMRENRDTIMALLDQACESKPDLVCLPETFTTIGAAGRGSRTEKSETIPGPTIDAAASRARQHRCYVVCPIETQRDGRHYNSAVILDRQGQIAGIYDKACPVTSTADYSDLESGISPGPADIPVFDLDFGRIGIQICFDAGFPENWQQLRDKGAQLVLWPSAYDGGNPLWAYAYLHHYYVVSSVRSGQSRFIDPCGAILLETDKGRPVISRNLSLDYVVSHLDFNYSIADRIKAKYGNRVDVRRPTPGSNHFMVESMDPAITCRQLQEEFGFESTFQYHDRHRTAYRQIRAGQPLTAQQPLHGSRPQHRKS